MWNSIISRIIPTKKGTKRYKVLLCGLEGITIYGPSSYHKRSLACLFVCFFALCDDIPHICLCAATGKSTVLSCICGDNQLVDIYSKHILRYTSDNTNDNPCTCICIGVQDSVWSAMSNNQ
jgi:hypothetical protein